MDAEQINFEIQEDIKDKESQIEVLNEEIKELGRTQRESQDFINKLNQFV